MIKGSKSTEKPAKIENYVSVPYQEAEKTAYVLEIIQLNHERIYSKLFQN